MPLDWLHYGFGDFVEAQSRRYQGATAITPDRRCTDEWERGPLTYSDLYQVVKDRQNLLKSAGLVQGDRIALWGDNSIDWLTTWIGAVASGLVVVPLNSRLTLSEVAMLCKESNVRALIVDDPIAQRGGGRVASVARQALDSPEFEGVDLWWMRAADNIPFPKLGTSNPRWSKRNAHVSPLPNGVAMIQFTSGSTGIPKGVLVKEGAMLAVAACNSRRWMLDRSDVVMGVLPLHHNSGAVYTTLTALSSGSTIQLLSNWTGGDGLSGLYAPEQVTVLPAIDAILDDLARLPGKPLPKLRLIASAFTPAFCRRLVQRFGVDVANTYGLTECSPTVVTGDLRDSQELRAEFIGRPHIGLKVRIADIASGETELPAGEEGEIQVLGWANMEAYLRPEHDEKAWTKEGWLRTGDLGVINKDGYIKFSGRLKELIRTGGENVSPREIEEVMQRHPLIDRVAVIPLPHPRFSERVTAVVLGGDDCTTAESINGLQDLCRKHLAPFKLPRLVLRIDRFPETASKKIDKLTLRSAVAAWLDGKTFADNIGPLRFETLWDRDQDLARTKAR